MINAVSKAAYLKATTQVVNGGIKPLVAVGLTHKETKVNQSPTPLSSYTLSKALVNGPPKASISITGSPVNTQVRFAHSDLAVPDFSEYRRNSTKNVNARSDPDSRGAFTYFMAAGASVAGVYGAKEVVGSVLATWSASADVLAMSKIEVNLKDVPEGKSVTFKWRGKPLFIRHRTAAEIATERGVAHASLRDPQQDHERVKDPKFLIVIGVCTHLGCVPIANAGDFGGYYCPCHGSHYDASGRIRKGPAPLNLEIPQYEFVNDLVIVG